MQNKKMTIEDINIGIKRVEKSVEDLAIITQNGFKELEKKLEGKMDQGFGEVNVRLDRVEKNMTNHGNRIENLEDRMRKVETVLEK